MFKNKTKLAVIGLGYVGLPLAVEFAKKRLTIGFDIKKKRIEELKSGIDKTLELTNLELKRAKKLILTSNKRDLKLANCYIVAVPTPIDKLKSNFLFEIIFYKLFSKILTHKTKKYFLCILSKTFIFFELHAISML